MRWTHVACDLRITSVWLMHEERTPTINWHVTMFNERFHPFSSVQT